MVDLILAGLVLAFVGLVVLAISMFSRDGKTGGEVKGGGVVMLGPIPIIFGSDAKWASVAIVLAIILVVLTFLLGLV